MTTTAGACPVSAADSFNRLLALDEELVRCPAGVFSALRDDAPVHWAERLNCFVVSRYADIMEVLRDTATYSSAKASGPSSVTSLAERLRDDSTTPPELLAKVERRLRLSESPVLLTADPPLHKRQRSLVNQGFTPRRVKLMEPEIRRLAHELLDRVAQSGTMEFVSQFALPLPMTVIADVLGVHQDRHQDFKRWSNAFTRGVGAMDLARSELVEIFDAVDEFYDYFTEQIEARRVEPRDDLLSDLVAARIDGEQPLTLDEMLQMLVILLVGGNETTTNLLTAVLYRLTQDPELMAAVRADQTLIAALTEEILRLEPPVQGLFRIATRDVDLAGTSIPAGSMLWLAYASGNRDETALGVSDDVVLDDAERRPHLTFGRGEHYCLGANIARLEVQVGLEVLFERLDGIRLRGDTLPPVLPSFVMHGITSLPIDFASA